MVTVRYAFITPAETMRSFATILAICLYTGAQAQVVTSAQNGPWSSPGTWDCGCIPAFTDTVVVVHPVEITSDYTFIQPYIHVMPAGELFNTLPLAIVSNSYFFNEGHVLFIGSAHIGAWFVDHGLAEFVGEVYFSATVIVATGALIQVEGDFHNYSIVDGDGAICVSDSTVNLGYLIGAFDFCDQSPTTVVAPFVDDNTIGVVSPNVTFCTNGPCATGTAGVAQVPFADVSLGPNPASSQVRLSGVSVAAAPIGLVDPQGRSLSVPVVRSGAFAELDVTGLAPGLYHVVLRSNGVERAWPLIVAPR